MADTMEYISELFTQKQILKKSLETQNLEVSENDTFNTLIEKTKDIGKGISKKIYSFGVLSDVHLKDTNFGADENNANADYEKALSYCDDNGAEFICIPGDLVANNRPIDDSESTDSMAEWVGELELLVTNNTTHFNGKEVHHCIGNHDATPLGHYGNGIGLDEIVHSYGDGTMNAEEVYTDITGKALNYTFEHEGDIFIMFSMYYWYYVNFCRIEDIQWLTNKLEEYKEKRVFLFFHLPLPDVFDVTNQGLGVLAEGQVCRSNEFRDLMRLYPNVVWFSGHSHYDLSLEATYDNPNTYRGENTATMIHCASCSYTRLPSGESYINVPLGSQGYMVDVFDDKIVVNGIDFALNTNGVSISSAKYNIKV